MQIDIPTRAWNVYLTGGDGDIGRLCAVVVGEHIRKMADDCEDLALAAWLMIEADEVDPEGRRTS